MLTGITVTCVAKRRIKLIRALNKEKVLPSSDDLTMFNEYLKDETEKLCSKEEFKYEDWDTLATVLLARIVLFNKRRIAGVEEMTLTDIRQMRGRKADSDINSLDVSERLLASR